MAMVTKGKNIERDKNKSINIQNKHRFQKMKKNN